MFKMPPKTRAFDSSSWPQLRRQRALGAKATSVLRHRVTLTMQGKLRLSTRARTRRRQLGRERASHDGISWL
jgi:hypothetical protein